MNQMQQSPADALKRCLTERGAMSVGDYMRWCLTGREHSYYRKGNPLGASGDFITAPEICQIFGELMAIWSYAVWQSMNAPHPFLFAELGPGRGTLMQDALRAGRAQSGFVEAAEVHLIETSASLRESQREALLSYCRPQWHEDIAALPKRPAIIIANEFFDALPVEQHIYQEGSWHRRMVTLNAAGEPVFAVGRLALPPVELMPADPPREGDILECRPGLTGMMYELGRRAVEAPLALLVADYGYERRDYGDTLQAVRRHGYADPFEAPGDADLSAHVNFEELALAAKAAKLEVWGPLPQSDFLLSLGLEQRLRQLMNSAKENQRAALYLGARRLVDPFQMGSLFKVMVITSPGLAAPPPFQRLDDKL